MVGKLRLTHSLQLNISWQSPTRALGQYLLTRTTYVLYVLLGKRKRDLDSVLIDLLHSVNAELG